jgi:HPr kinase/phosphorylase
MTLQNIHASCVAIGGYGLLIRGSSGSGKSDLILRLLDEPNGAVLVADDQVYISERAGALYAAAPAILAGKLEIRGHGIVTRPHLAEVKISHIVDLVQPQEIARMPEAAELRATAMGVEFPRLKLDPFQASASARIRAFLRG